MKTTELPKGTVLDEPMARALLYAAVQEGLLDDNPMIGDGFVRMIMNSTPSPTLVENALEHLVITGKVYVPFWLPRDWRGALFEEGTLVPSDPGLDEDLIEVPSLSPGLTLAMLHDRGQIWTQGHLVDRYNAFIKAYQAWEAAGGKSFEGMEIRMSLKHIAPIQPEEYPPEQVAAWKSVSGAYDSLKPVLACHLAYRQVLTSSLRNGALSALPVDADAVAAPELPLFATTTERTTLLRIASKALRRVPIGTSLRETLAIARSPEAQDLRHKLGQWTEALRSNEADPVALVLGEVERARVSLKTAKTLARIGEYSTIIGVPASVAGLFIAGPLITIGGLVISAIGGVALGGQKYIEQMNSWAMYGQE